MAVKPEISVIIPVYNEAESIAGLHTEIVEVLKRTGKTFEIIAIDDGSSDNTLPVASKLKPLKVISLRINQGQSTALDVGIKAAEGKILITLDGDGQNDPHDIPQLLKKLAAGYDVVCGWRFERKDPRSKRWVSKGAGWLRSILVDDTVHDAGCTLRAYRGECFTDLTLDGEMHRMIPALLRWRGFKVTEMKVNHRPREKGVSKYGWGRIMRGFLDMIAIWFWRKYSHRPLHLFGTVGVLLMGAAMLLLTGLAIARLFFGYYLANRIWPLVGISVFLAGLQLFVSGILADLVIKNNTQGRTWLIKNVAENK